MKLLFLHLPKTAGQSIHSELVRNFPGEVAPLRTNADFPKHTTTELARYRVFSGHLDWDRLDFVAQPRIVVTVLRDPLERIVSFYRFLRRTAARLPAEQLMQPTSRGMFLISTLSLEDYFCDSSLPERQFLDDHYDNFYTHFFAARNYNGHALHRRKMAAGQLKLEDLVDLAEQNLRSLNLVADISRLSDLEDYLAVCYRKQFNLTGTRINTDNNGEFAGSPLAKLAEFGLTPRTEARIREMCVLDDELLARLGLCQPTRGDVARAEIAAGHAFGLTNGRYVKDPQVIRAGA